MTDVNKCRKINKRNMYTIAPWLSTLLFVWFHIAYICFICFRTRNLKRAYQTQCMKQWIYIKFPRSLRTPQIQMAVQASQSSNHTMANLNFQKTAAILLMGPEAARRWIETYITPECFILHYFCAAWL